jgi:hypothetical protein
MTKEWDLNIFFKEVWDENVEEYVLDDVLTINPVVWTMGDGATQTWYTDIIYTTTFAEARYLRSQYPESEYGYDWTDSLHNFLEIAPPRLKSLLWTLPNAYDTDKINELSGLRVLPANTDGQG